MKEIALLFFLGYILVLECYWLMKQKNLVLSCIGKVSILFWCLIYIVESQYNTNFIFLEIWFYLFLIIKFACIIYKDKRLNILYLIRMSIYFFIGLKLL